MNSASVRVVSVYPGPPTPLGVTATKTQSQPARDTWFSGCGRPVQRGDTFSVSVGRLLNPAGVKEDGNGGQGPSPPQLISGQPHGCRANGETRTPCCWAPCPWLGAAKRQAREELQEGPSQSIIYRPDRVPTLRSRVGIWDTRPHAGLFLCQLSIQRGTLHAGTTRPGGHERWLARRWGPMSFLSPLGRQLEQTRQRYRPRVSKGPLPPRGVC